MLNYIQGYHIAKITAHLKSERTKLNLTKNSMIQDMEKAQLMCYFL